MLAKDEMSQNTLDHPLPSLTSLLEKVTAKLNQEQYSVSDNPTEDHTNETCTPLANDITPLVQTPLVVNTTKLETKTDKSFESPVKNTEEYCDSEAYSPGKYEFVPEESQEEEIDNGIVPPKEESKSEPYDPAHPSPVTPAASVQYGRFPPASRMFIGNLAADRVSKEAIERLFRPYGKIYEISFKKSYGFVQFDNATSCRKAIQSEQGRLMSGLRLDLKLATESTQRDRVDSKRSRQRSRSRSPARKRKDRKEDRLAETILDQVFTSRIFRDFLDVVRRNTGPPRHEEFPLARKSGAQLPDCLLLTFNVDKMIIWQLDALLKGAGLSVDVVQVNAQKASLRSLIKQRILEGVRAIAYLDRSHQHNSVSVQIISPSDALYEYEHISYEKAKSILVDEKLTRQPCAAITPSNPQLLQLVTALQQQQQQQQQLITQLLPNLSVAGTALHGMYPPTNPTIPAPMIPNMNQKYPPTSMGYPAGSSVYPGAAPVGYNAGANTNSVEMLLQNLKSLQNAQPTMYRR